MRDRGEISREEAILIAERIIETCNAQHMQMDSPSCQTCPFYCDDGYEDDCWLCGFKIKLDNLVCFKEKTEENKEQLKLALAYSTAYPLESKFKEYMAVLDRIAKDGVNIPLEEYARMENVCLSFLDMIQELNKSVSLGSLLAGIIAKRSGVKNDKEGGQ